MPWKGFGKYRNATVKPWLPTPVLSPRHSGAFPFRLCPQPLALSPDAPFLILSGLCPVTIIPGHMPGTTGAPAGHTATFCRMPTYASYFTEAVTPPESGFEPGRRNGTDHTRSSSGVCSSSSWVPFISRF